MRELHIAPGDVVRIMVEEDADGRRVLLRVGNGRHRALTPERARALAQLLIMAAIEASTVPDDQRPPAAPRPSEYTTTAAIRHSVGLPRVEDFAPGPRIEH